jgi:hypothetical protein
VNMKPLPKKMVFALILMVLTVIVIKAGVDHGFIPTPGSYAAVMPKPPSVQRDADWYATQHIMQANGYSIGDDGLIHTRQPDDTTGYPALDNVLRFLWNNCGILMLVFGLLAGLSILGYRLNHSGETHNEQLRREAEELAQPGLSEDIHEPFNAPEGMQTQYIPIRTRR